MTSDASEPAEEFGIKDPLLRYVLRHPGFTVATLTATAFLVKVMFVARGNAEIALALVAATGPAELFVGLAMALFPAFILALATVLALAATAYADRSRQSLLLGSLSVLAGFTFVTTAPLLTLGFVILLGGVAYAWWRARRPASRGIASVRGLIFAGMVGVAISIASPTMWLPPEVFRVADSPQGLVTTGYFIEEEGEWVTILDDARGRLIRLRTSQIEDREICSQSSPDWWNRSLISNSGPPRHVEGCHGSSSTTAPIPSPP